MPREYPFPFTPRLHTTTSDSIFVPITGWLPAADIQVRPAEGFIAEPSTPRRWQRFGVKVAPKPQSPKGT